MMSVSVIVHRWSSFREAIVQKITEFYEIISQTGGAPPLRGGAHNFTKSIEYQICLVNGGNLLQLGTNSEGGVGG